MTRRTDRKLTGRHVLIIAVSAFAVVFTANMTMLYAATGTFPGLVVKNSYVASQSFDARTRAQEALGWTGAADYADGQVLLRITDGDGRPVEGLLLSGMIGRPATDIRDREVTFRAADGLYATEAALEPGQWLVTFEAVDAEGRTYNAEAHLFVSRGG